ncbi:MULTISPECIES: hypothetical protein [unclassified Pseudomonas]|uniref:hypothetical protein n=1 Tax=unclassified Pseudomonas TaxID=196821 RepID=UPI000595A18D|nr:MULTISPECIES: hypothetical protein [unclassified Pseudomonas]
MFAVVEHFAGVGLQTNATFWARPVVANSAGTTGSCTPLKVKRAFCWVVVSQSVNTMSNLVGVERSPLP